MTDQKKLPLPCLNLDGTVGIQCLFRGPYNRTRNKPSLARPALGDAETGHGIIQGMPFLMCNPAEAVFVNRDTNGTQYTVEWLIEQQQTCTKFKERG